MGRDTLTGSRIRERRAVAGMRQAELAKAVGISPSYLNLIEHNRRRIGGKLLVDIAMELGVETSLLSEGAEAGLISTLEEAAADGAQAGAEVDRADEFAGRFPGWAALIARQHSRIENLERTAVTLTDRLTHDPHLATSMHEMLTMVTAIRSTAGILAEPGEIEPEWQTRFHRNLNEDSQRLADSSQQLVAYLDGAGDAAASLTLPTEEVDAMLSTHGFRFDDLVEADATELRKFVQSQTELTSEPSQGMAMTVIRQLLDDARRLPAGRLEVLVAELGAAPVDIANMAGVPLAVVLRRMAAFSKEVLPVACGLVMCDGAGTLMLRKAVDGFPMPRFSAACPKWPLFQALARPMQPLRQVVTVTGRDARSFECFAVADPIGPMRVDAPPLYHSYMLIIPQEAHAVDGYEVGSTCRVCPSQGCEGRREPSLLA
ncbi:helix-turn-helix protein [Shimia sp. SK013]|uniref:helix-turn-helix transcriptional regulator n=1 Tax=Shimia sp. SK013 TaxID=1389006 RepID=UPI0006B521ED|nr:helix-turn-helix transcriptional regulator [Shimia sp. SK013]KPA23330.1 helix-turn-helix protein [Shimia sp. SK013]